MSNPPNRSEQNPQVGNLWQNFSELKSRLRNHEPEFRSLTEHAPVGIFLDDAEGNAIYINRKCAELVGVPAEEALNFDWIPHLHPDDRDAMVSAWQEAFTTKTEFRMEYRWVHADGRVVWTLGEVIPIQNEDGEADVFIGCLTDITSRKEAEIEAARLQKQLVQAEKMESTGRLAGGVAHDYNNMLQVILGFTELATSELDPEHPVQEQLLAIQEAAQRSSKMTRQLLTFARKQVTHPENIDLHHAIEEMLNMLRNLIGPDIRLEWSPCPEALWLRMDPTQLDRIVMNLCVNAREAIQGEGSIVIETHRVTLDEHQCRHQANAAPGDYIRLTITDNGEGMDPVTLANLFEPFYSTKKDHAHSGTGLGLATVYGAVTQNGGFITVKSELEQGSSFHIHLPPFSEP